MMYKLRVMEMNSFLVLCYIPRMFMTNIIQLLDVDDNVLKLNCILRIDKYIYMHS